MIGAFSNTSLEPNNSTLEPCKTLEYNNLSMDSNLFPLHQFEEDQEEEEATVFVV